MSQVPSWLLGFVLAGVIATLAYRARALSRSGAGAAAADTWATEIGTLSRETPRSILDWRPVEPGTSGGITSQGLVAGICGAGFVALVALLVRWPPVAALAALVGGTIGCLLDSVIGASLQGRRWCATCETGTEQRI